MLLSVILLVMLVVLVGQMVSYENGRKLEYQILKFHPHLSPCSLTDAAHLVIRCKADCVAEVYFALR